MTGGRAIILGETGRNFAAGMSGGIAYVLDEKGTFPPLINMEMVEIDPLTDEDLEYIQMMVAKHTHFTGSTVGQRVLERWDNLSQKFVKIMPTDYKRALADLQRLAEEEQARQDELAASPG
jgi:glutamate synthase (NADPH) large chain